MDGHIAECQRRVVIEAVARLQQVVVVVLRAPPVCAHMDNDEGCGGETALVYIRH